MTVIPASFVITGTVHADEPVLVTGRVKGTVSAVAHDVTLAPQSNVDGTVLGRIITVGGASRGRLIARELVRVLDGADVEADVACPRFTIDDGARFVGRVEPARTEAAIRVAQHRAPDRE